MIHIKKNHLISAIDGILKSCLKAVFTEFPSACGFLLPY